MTVILYLIHMEMQTRKNDALKRVHETIGYQQQHFIARIILEHFDTPIKDGIPTCHERNMII